MVLYVFFGNKISRPPRYDRFDNPPYIQLKIPARSFLGAPRYDPVAVPEIFRLTSVRKNFDRCHSHAFAASATGGARRPPRFDNPPYFYVLPKINRLYFIIQTDYCQEIFVSFSRNSHLTGGRNYAIINNTKGLFFTGLEQMPWKVIFPARKCCLEEKP